MTVDQLLKPRIKILGAYPFGPYPIGSIIEPDGAGNFIMTKTHHRNEFGEEVTSENFYPADAAVKQFPLLFAFAPWYEGRSMEQMPEYLKLANYPGPGEFIIKVSNWGLKDFNNKKDVLGFEVFGKMTDYNMQFNVSIHVPATQEQYNDFIKQQGDAGKKILFPNDFANFAKRFAENWSVPFIYEPLDVTDESGSYRIKLEEQLYSDVNQKEIKTKSLLQPDLFTITISYCANRFHTPEFMFFLLLQVFAKSKIPETCGVDEKADQCAALYILDRAEFEGRHNIAGISRKIEDGFYVMFQQYANPDMHLRYTNFKQWLSNHELFQRIKKFL